MDYKVRSSSSSEGEEEVEGLEDEGEELKRQQAILEKEKVCIVEYVLSAQGLGPLMKKGVGAKCILLTFAYVM